MSTKIKIDQAGLSPAGTAGVSRTDGKADGALVTLTNTDPQGLTEFRLLWKPPEDTTAEASLAATGSVDVWTFTPTVGARGTYLVELVEDGLPVERRTFGVRLPLTGLRIPALNERSSKAASLINDGTDQVELSDDNATDYPGALAGYPYAGWSRAQDELYRAIEIKAGTPGPVGPAGNDGADGADGAPGATGPTGATGSLPAAATGSGDGFLQRITLTPANDGLVWANAAAVPDGGEFEFIGTGPGGGGASGDAVLVTATTANGGSAGGGGARPPSLRVPRAWVIAQLPITFTIGTGGNGSARRTNTVNSSTVAGAAGSSGSKATRIDGASGLLLFAGAGAGAGTTTGGGGGGCNGNASAGTGGLPDDADSTPNNWTHGGTDQRTIVGNRLTTRHGGGGGAQKSSSAAFIGGESAFGGAGGGGGGWGLSAGVGNAGAPGGSHAVHLTGNTPAGVGAGTAGPAGSAGDAGAGQAGNDNRAGCGGGGGGAVGFSSSPRVRAGDGGAGGNPGGGGGGGGGFWGAAGETATSGAGGRGGDGEIRIIIRRG